MWADWSRRNGSKIIDFVTRQRNLGLALCSISASLLLLGGGGAFVEFGYEGNSVKYGLNDEPNLFHVALIVVAGAAGFIFGLFMVLGAYKREQKLNEIGKVLAVEFRGLVDTSDRPLISAIPTKYVGQRIDLLKDVRHFVSDGNSDFQAALRELNFLRRDMHVARGDSSRENVTVIAGGVLQVPFLFHVGNLIDDEGHVVLFDWNRTERRWKELLSEGNDETFAMESEDLNAATEVVLAVSASYLADIDAIKRTFPGKPLVHLRLANPSPNTIWSEQWQSSLTQQFLETVASLGNKQVSLIHLVLVVPSSLALRLGGVYDYRNMPHLRCYQYEKEANPPYPWSIQMASAKNPALHVLTNDLK